MTTNNAINTMKQILKALQVLLLVTLSVASQAAVESTTYILTDHLGSPILATDENGDTLWQEDYLPYGKQLTNEDGDNSVGFTGHKDDKALGVTYMQGRWYHQDMGRFLAIDPVGFVEENPASFNRYAYANSNPYLFIDPDGNQPSYSHIGPYLRGQYRRGELLAWQMMGRTYLEEGVYAVAGGAIGKVAGKVINEGVKRAAPHIRNLVRDGNVAKNLGTKLFSRDGLTGLGGDVTKRGSELIFDNFSVVANSGKDLISPAKQLLKYAQDQGAKTIRFKGDIFNEQLRAKFGKETFDFSVPATKEGLANALKELR